MEKEESVLMMVGVQDCVECPQCKFEQAHYEFQTRDFTETLFCPRCGYNMHSVAVVDRKREKIEGKPYFKKTKDGKIILRHYESKGYGSYAIYSPDGFGTIGCVPKDKVEQEKMIAKLKESRRHGYKVNLTLVDENNNVTEVFEDENKSQ